MATSQVIELAATRAAARTRTGGSTPAAPRNRFVAFLATMIDVMREARELELRMLGRGGYRRLGES